MEGRNGEPRVEVAPTRPTQSESDDLKPPRCLLSSTMSSPKPPPPPPAAAAASSHGTIDISQLPSLKDGMTEADESMKRRKTCRFIEEVGRVLKLPRVAIATAMVFFHRFYAKHSFKEHDRFEVAVAAILLAAKTEESPKKLNVVIEESLKTKNRAMQAGRISQSSDQMPLNSDGTLDTKAESFVRLKERILLLERVILHTIGFELSIDHPYKFLVETIKKLVHKRQIEFINTSKGGPQVQQQELMNRMVQVRLVACFLLPSVLIYLVASLERNRSTP